MNLEEFARRGAAAQRAVDNILAEQFGLIQKRISAPGFSRGQVTECEVSLLVAKDGGEDVIAIVTEVDNNPGASITNAAENVATEIVKKFDLDPKHLIYIEHYRHGRWGGCEYGHGLRSSWDHVTFDWNNGRASHPQWKPLPFSGGSR